MSDSECLPTGRTAEGAFLTQPPNLDSLEPSPRRLRSDTAARQQDEQSEAAAEAAGHGGSANDGAAVPLPANLQIVYDAMAGLDPEARERALLALLAEQAATNEKLVSAREPAPEDNRRNATQDSAKAERPAPVNLSKQVTSLVNSAVHKSVDHRAASRRATALSEGWQKITEKVDEATEPNDWTVKLPTDKAANGVRLPKALTNMLAPGFFKLEGHSFLHDTERYLALQKSVDRHIRKCSLAVLKDVGDWKAFAAQEHEALLNNVRTGLKTQLEELYAGTDVPEEAALARRDTALKTYDEKSLAKLDELETERAQKAKDAAAKSAEMDKAELEAREVKEPETLASHLKSVVVLESEERDRVMVKALEQWQGDGAAAGELADVLKLAREDAAEAKARAAESESDSDKLSRLRAEQKASQERLIAFEKEKKQGNGKPTRKTPGPANSNKSAQDGNSQERAAKKKRGTRGGKRSGRNNARA